ncbi:MAG TPA: (d)CMP kinase [Casimicrobiaceae bacterium]|jgi:cytidylate kinase|nr:(d)CMP kinase [Casimicrobiaceae bacterium]
MLSADAAVPVIAVDGPAASGKGTIAAAVADALRFHLLDSGALYRLVALRALDSGTALDDAAALALLARALDATFRAGRVHLAGRDVSETLRGEDVSAAASHVAVHPGVRAALTERQRAFRRSPGLVADGRDMGTVIFPDAVLKVFVTASPGERAARRHKQLIAKGISVTIESLLREIAARDARDAGRTAAPLAAAPDAVRLDTTGVAPEASIAAVLALCRERGLAAAST